MERSVPLLIAEDLLLLITDDQTGRNTMPMFPEYVLAGAVLVELSLAGSIRITEKGESTTRKNRVTIVPDVPRPTDALLAERLDLIARKPHWDPSGLVVKLSWQLERLVYERLARAEILHRDEHRWLGIFPANRWPALDGSRKAQLLAAIDSVLLHGTEPDDRVGALIGLLVAGDHLVKTVDRGRGIDRRSVKRRAKPLLTRYWGAKAAATAIQTAQAAIL